MKMHFQGQIKSYSKPPICVLGYFSTRPKKKIGCCDLFYLDVPTKEKIYLAQPISNFGKKKQEFSSFY